MRHLLGRFLQACGLVLAPMALFYYVENKMGTMEWMILLSAVVVFVIGRYVDR